MADRAAIEAVAEAWASIDGKLDGFRHGKTYPNSERDVRESYYDGYLCDAEELIRRVEKHGFVVSARHDG